MTATAGSSGDHEAQPRACAATVASAEEQPCHSEQDVTASHPSESASLHPHCLLGHSSIYIVSICTSRPWWQCIFAIPLSFKSVVHSGSFPSDLCPEVCQHSLTQRCPVTPACVSVVEMQLEDCKFIHK